MKKPGLWDRGVAIGEPGQEPDRKKMTRSVRQRYGLGWLKSSVYNLEADIWAAKLLYE